MNNNVVRAVNVKHITFNDRAKADEILAMMRNMADDYSVIYVSDLYCLINRYMPYCYTGYYWTSYQVKNAGLYRTRDGYILDLPYATLECSKSPTATYRDYPQKPTPEPINITVNTETVDSVEEVMADVFKYAYTITDRPVNISII